MLRHVNRFHGHGSLRYVYARGQAIRSSQLTMKYIANPRRRHGRFSVVISKKVLKSAVKRNRVRRRIYEIIRLELPHIRGGFDVVIMVFSPEVLVMPYSDLRTAVKQLFSQAGLYK